MVARQVVVEQAVQTTRLGPIGALVVAAETRLLVEMVHLSRLVLAVQVLLCI
jgi:hypothetical protein